MWGDEPLTLPAQLARLRSMLTFAVTVIPTAALIDRKGIVRFIETGTSPYRLDELREMIEKLLAEN